MTDARAVLRLILQETENLLREQARNADAVADRCARLTRLLDSIEAPATPSAALQISAPPVVPTQKRVLRPAQAAEYVGLSKSMLDKLRLTGGGPR